MDDIHLESPGGTTARIAPDAGFCCLSWQVDGAEYLHLPAPEGEFRASPRTGGVPLLYPYANRLRSDPWQGHPEVKRDENGLPIHGFLLRFGDWDDVTASDDRVTARLDWAKHPGLLELFPHPHRLEVTFRVADRGLEVTTRVTADGGSDVPISFGWHPYLALPDVHRGEIQLEAADLEHVELDERGIPVRKPDGTLQAGEPADLGGPLEGRSLDDLFRLGEGARSFAMSGGGRRLRVHLDRAWHFLQLYSPHDADFACIEPMTAPVAALSDDRDHPVAAAGETFESVFGLEVDE